MKSGSDVVILIPSLSPSQGVQVQRSRIVGSGWGSGCCFSEDFKCYSVLGKGLPQRSLMKQLFETVLACAYFLIQGGFECIPFIWGEPRVIQLWERG